MSGIVIRNLNKSYAYLPVFKNFCHTFEEQKISAIIGPSGCGKTTLLRIIGRLDCDYQGEILHTYSKISFVFQEPRLLDWVTVYENIAFVVDQKQITKETSHKIYELLDMVGLGEAGNKYPAELSGGMKQRVAICRAFLYPGQLLLMDEPFNSLDQQLRVDLSEAFFAMARKEKRTTLFVTHDLDMAGKADAFCRL